MALTYAESAALMNDVAFRDRIKVACLTFANYIVGEPANVPAHTTRVKWANQTMVSPDGSAMTVQPTVVMDPQVQQDGSNVTDVALQTAVETAVNKLI
jgi:hypothetical protein